MGTTTLGCVLMLFGVAPVLFHCSPLILDELNNAERAVVSARRMLMKGRPKDCSDLFMAGQTHSGVYDIFPFEDSETRTEVYCDMESDGGGWTVFQRRGQFRNPVYYFYKTWDEYARGFGNLTKEFWLGNNVIHALTANKNMTMRIQLKNHTGDIFTADYDAFKLGNEAELFKITFGNYKGPSDSDGLALARGLSFSTKDKDHDEDPNANCAAAYKGGWWYASCHHANLNGLNLNGPHDSRADGIEWSKRDGNTGLYYYSYPETEMKMRDVTLESVLYT
uniref:Fibrinogen-related protein n=1 Tax=Ornithodoros erraticus TaxID=265619 RepID=A0A293MNT6_ORNER